MLILVILYLWTSQFLLLFLFSWKFILLPLSLLYLVCLSLLITQLLGLNCLRISLEAAFWWKVFYFHLDALNDTINALFLLSRLLVFFTVDHPLYLLIYPLSLLSFIWCKYCPAFWICLLFKQLNCNCEINWLITIKSIHIVVTFLLFTLTN